MKNITDFIKQYKDDFDTDSYGFSNLFVSYFILKTFEDKQPVKQYTCQGGSLKISYEDFIKNFDFGDLIYEISNDGGGKYFYFNEESGCFYTITNYVKPSNITVFYIGKKDRKDLEKYYNKNTFSTESKSIYMITQDARGNLELTSFQSTEKTLIKDNYDKSVVDSFDYIVDEFSSQNPSGRLAILSGETGTGKTFYIRGLIEEFNKHSNVSVVFLPSKFISQVDSPSLIPLFIEHKNRSKSRYSDDFEDGPPSLSRNKKGLDEDNIIIFILEDADFCLVPRESDNISVLSSLLNFTDGIFGSILNLRIIATTNANKLKFDRALTRPGRLLKHVSVDLLEPEKANKIYQRLTDNKGDYVFTKPASLAMIYAKSRDEITFEEELIEEKKNRPMGF